MNRITYVGRGVVERREVAPPTIDGPLQALVRPIAVATCDLDKALVRGASPWDGPFPLGHEGVAEVLEVGDQVRAVKVGDHVCLPYQISCGSCGRCRAGLTAHCTGHGGPTPGPHQFYGFSPTARDWGGFFSDVVRVPFADHMLLPLHPGVAPATAASLSDNIVDGWRTVAPGLAAQPGAPVLVVGGMGAIGLYAVASAVALGSERVVYVDRRQHRLDVATRLGAETELVDATRWPRSMEPFFPVAVDASGSHDGLMLALRSTDFGGTCTSASWFFRPQELPLFELTLRGITFKNGLIQARGGMPVVLDLIASGALQADLVTDRVLPWDDAGAALPELSEKLVFTRPPVSP